MMSRIKNGLSVLSDVGGVCSPPAAMGSRRFFHAGGGGGASSLVKRDMFRAGDIPILFSGRKTRECVGGFDPHQCNTRHMLPYFARALASSSTSQSSGQTPRQEPTKTKKKECQIISSSKLQRETDDETSSLNQNPMAKTLHDLIVEEAIHIPHKKIWNPKVSLWDGIIPSKEHAKFWIHTTNKYRFTDQGSNLRGKEFNLTLHWHVMPKTGKMSADKIVMSGYRLPEEYR